MSRAKPAYVLVGGICHTPAFWESVIQDLSSREYVSEAVALPTCGENTENAKQSDEVAAIQRTVTKYLDAGHDVVLVLHSYAGWPGSRAIKGLDRDTRQMSGHQTGIIEVVFVAAFLLPDNARTAMYTSSPPWLTLENGRRIPNDHAIPLLFSDMDGASQKYWFSQFRWHRRDFTAETVPDAPWHLSIPKTYVITTNDKTATPEWQFTMIKGVLDQSSDSWAIKSINSGHEPFLSKPKELVQIMLQPRVY